MFYQYIKYFLFVDIIKSLNSFIREISTIIMPIDSEFPKNHKVIGKHKHEDGRFHFVWGPGRSDAETSSNEQVQQDYKSRGEDYVPLGSPWYLRWSRLGLLYSRWGMHRSMSSSSISMV